jgi:hypothetical protein
MEITKEDEKKFAILYERYMEKKNEVNKMAEELFCKQGLEESMELKRRIESLPCEEEQVRLSFWDRIGLFFRGVFLWLF